MEEILCQHHNNCGGYCETESEVHGNLCSDCLDAENTDWRSNVEKLIAAHAEMLVDNPHCYFEIAYTRQTGFMAWICSAPKNDDPNRKVLAQGKGDTAEKAAGAALQWLGLVA